MRSIHLAAALLLVPLVIAPLSTARAQVSIVVGLGVPVTMAPPMLPDYVQPPMPRYGAIWTPGYWAYGGYGYYWVPGTWVMPPSAGLYWTPGYWDWREGSYVFSVGYWGPTVGYYGGINYGYGYGGSGYQGGEWRGRDFLYNRSANNFGSVHVGNAYDRPIAGGHAGERPSFNGPRGTLARPTAREEQAGRQGHTQPTAQQIQHSQAAAQDQALRASVNNGRPAIPATARPRQPNAAAEPARAAPPVHQAAPQQRQEQPAQRQAPQQRQEQPAQHQAAPQQRQEQPAQHQGAPPQRQEQPAQHQAPPQHQQSREEERR